MIRLKNAGQVDWATRMMTELGNELENCRSGSSLEDTRDRWLNWWFRADAQVRGLFVDSDLATSLYRTRQEIGRAFSDPRPYDVLNHEHAVWTDRFDEIMRELRSLKCFVERPGQIAVLDTSALIEGVDFREFEWHSLDGLSSREPVRLILPILVIEELDDLKRERRQHAASRARSVLRGLWELLGGNAQDSVSLPGKEVTVEVLLDDAWHVRRPVNDDEIVQQAVTIKEVTLKSVVLAAADLGMLCRGSAFGLAVAKVERERD